MPAIVERAKQMVVEKQKTEHRVLTDVSTKDLLQELAARIESGLYGLNIEDALGILDRRRVPIWLLQNNAWFSANDATDQQTIGKLVSGGKQDCDVLVEFVKKWGANVNERVYISSQALVRPIKPEEVPQECFAKKPGRSQAAKPVVEAVACVGLDEVFSEPFQPTVSKGDDLFSE